MEEYMGAITLFAGGVVPKGWYPCDGRLLSIPQNQSLYSLLGTNYGGDGKTTFGLPDLRGRAIVGSGPTIYTHYNNGASGGSETVPLAPHEVPTHTHMVAVSNIAGNATVVAGSVIAATAQTTNLPTAPNIYSDVGTGAVAALGSGSIGTTGGNLPHNNMQPFLVLNYCICAVGVYPSRN